MITFLVHLVSLYQHMHQCHVINTCIYMCVHVCSPPHIEWEGNFVTILSTTSQEFQPRWITREDEEELPLARRIGWPLR